MELSKSFWEKRWSEGLTQWDIGYPSPALIDYIGQVQNKDIQLLIPGCGNAYEAEKLWLEGFKSVHILDWSQLALDQFSARMPDFPVEQLHCEDFFEHRGHYDFIMEQTFFCALEPKLRPAYINQMHSLLKVGGKLFGLLFDFPLLDDGPPFGGSEADYRQLLSSQFDLELLETSTNSIKPRAGKEFFFIATKR